MLKKGRGEFKATKSRRSRKIRYDSNRGSSFNCVIYDVPAMFDDYPHQDGERLEGPPRQCPAAAAGAAHKGPPLTSVLVDSAHSGLDCEVSRPGLLGTMAREFEHSQVSRYIFTPQTLDQGNRRGGGRRGGVQPVDCCPCMRGFTTVLSVNQVQVAVPSMTLFQCSGLVDGSFARRLCPNPR